MGLEYVTGDLFESGLPAIAHGCNAEGKMGSGIAVQFRKQHPAMFQYYKGLCEQGVELGDVITWDVEAPPIIFNLITQLKPGPNAHELGIRRSIGQALQLCRDKYQVDALGIPRIGAGIGGMEWSTVEGALEFCSFLIPQVRLVVYTLANEEHKF